MRKLRAIMLISLLAAAGNLQAQDYFFGLGLRGGGIASGLDAKINFDPSNSMQMTLGLAGGVCFYGLYERQVPVIREGFHFFYGAGAHAGTWSWDKNKDRFTFGFDVIAGLEYKIRNYPIALSIDYKPCVNVTGDTGFKAYDFGLALRYTF